MKVERKLEYMLMKFRPPSEISFRGMKYVYLNRQHL